MKTAFRLLKKYFWTTNLQPEYLIFQATSRCNLHCQHCFLWQTGKYGWTNVNRGKNDLTLAEIKKISCSMQSFFFLNLGGGEPFTRHDLAQIAAVFYKNNQIQNLLIPTNGVLTLTILKTTEKILKMCPGLNVSVDVSLDGLGKFHNEIREGKDVFNKAVRTLKGLLRLKKAYANLQVGTITTHMSQNQKSLEAIYDYLKTKIKPDAVTFALIRGAPRQASAKNIDIGYYCRLNKKMEADYLKGKISGFRKIFLWPVAVAAKILMHRLVIDTYRHGYQIPCLAGRLNAVIYANGDVYPCEMLTARKIGNLRQVNFDFQKLWRSQKLKKILKEIKEKKCFCTHECHLPVNIIYSPKYFLKILKLACKLLLTPRR